MLARWAATLSAVAEGAAAAPIVPSSFIWAPPFALYWSRRISKVPAFLAAAIFCARATSGDTAAAPPPPLRWKNPGFAAYIEFIGLPSVETLPGLDPRDREFLCSEARPVIAP